MCDNSSSVDIQSKLQEALLIAENAGYRMSVFWVGTKAKDPKYCSVNSGVDAKIFMCMRACFTQFNPNADDQFESDQFGDEFDRMCNWKPDIEGNNGVDDQSTQNPGNDNFQSAAVQPSVVSQQPTNVDSQAGNTLNDIIIASDVRTQHGKAGSSEMEKSKSGVTNTAPCLQCDTCTDTNKSGNMTVVKEELNRVCLSDFVTSPFSNSEENCSSDTTKVKPLDIPVSLVELDPSSELDAVGEQIDCDIQSSFPGKEGDIAAKSSHLTTPVVNIRHRTGTQSVRRYQCSQCNAKFRNRSRLYIHLRSHSGEKLFNCSHCDYSCATAKELKRHQLIHTNKASYKCRYCDYVSYYNANLQIHERTHTGERPFKCRYCNYSAKQPSTLKVHERTHTGEKPYKCRYCTYASAQTAAVKKHEKTHERIRSHEKPH